MEFFADEIKEDSVICVIGECPKCHKGENSLVILSRSVHPNIREKQKGNEMIYLRCLSCKASLMKTKFVLMEGN